MSHRLIKFFVAAGALILQGVPLGFSQETDVGFRTPSNNIHCQLFVSTDSDQSYPPTLRCDVMVIQNRPPPRPADCDLEWGQAFELNENGSGRRICYGDTIMSQTLQILPYGSRWSEKGFTCLSETDGVACTNKKGAGFKLSRSSQQVF